MVHVHYDWWDDFRRKTFDKWARQFKVAKSDIKVKTSRPFSYLFFQALPETIENVIEGPERYYKEMMYWIKYRTTQRYNIIDTGLKPGYYDVDHIMNAALWKLVVDFVEVEAAWMSCTFDDERRKKYKSKRWLGEFRSRELGEEYFNWHINEADNNADIKKAKKAIFDAYLWYKDVLPKLEAELETMWVDHKGLKHDEVMKNVRKASAFENKISKQNTKHLVNIVTYKDILWT